MVRHSMCFDGFCDFYQRRLYIRAMYSYLNRDEKEVYKFYVYSRRILREHVCDMIWGFINATDDDDELSKYCICLEAEYKRCQCEGNRT